MKYYFFDSHKEGVWVNPTVDKVLSVHYRFVNDIAHFGSLIVCRLIERSSVNALIVKRSLLFTCMYCMQQRF